ncbi:MAG: UTP--glucose-1-phosphate uridylyltransferase, partial [Acidaminococcaceae bacterium]
IELELSLEQNHKEELLKMVRDISNISLHYIRQKEPLGLGHAILCAKHFVGSEPFAVLLGDDVVDAKKPCLKQLMEVYDATGSSVLGVQEVAEDKVSSYGIVSPTEQTGERTWRINDMVEKPTREEAPSRLAVLGRYIIAPEIFEILEKTLPGRGGEIQLTDALKVLAQEKSVLAYNFEGRRYDVGDKQGFLEATVEQALKRPELRTQFLSYLQKIVAQES